jgi:hypothetical protein
MDWNKTGDAVLNFSKNVVTTNNDTRTANGLSFYVDALRLSTNSIRYDSRFHVAKI